MNEIKPNPDPASLLPEPITGGLVPGTLPLPPALSAGPDALGLIKALQRRWRMALGLGLLLAAASGAAAWFILPKPKYAASATLSVSSNPRYIIFDPKERLADYRTYQRTQVALVKSRFVLSDALKNPEISALATVREHADPLDWLSQQLKVGFPDSSELLEIVLSGDNPEDVAKLVNAVLDSYLTLVVDEEQQDRKSRLDKLRELWKRYQGNLQAKRKEMRELSDAIGSTDKETLSFAHQSKIQHLDMAEQEQLRVDFELRKAEAELSVQEAQDSDTADEGALAEMIDEEVENAPHVREVKQRIQSLKNHYDRFGRTARHRSDSALVAVASQIKRARQELATYQERLRPSIAAQVRNRVRGDRQAGLVKLRAQINVARLYKQAIDREIERLQREAKTINRGTLDLSQQQDEIAVIGDTARKIKSEVEAMEVELGAPSRIRVIDRAVVPPLKDRLLKLKASSAAASGTLALILLAVSLWEYRARRIASVDEVVHGLGLRLVGTLPPLQDSRAWSRQGTGKKEVKRRSESRLIESVDAARTMILHASRTGSLRSVMVTSAEKGEGKTLLSCHLAASLARSGRRTLLVDCDLRSPAAHRLFDLAPGPGLSEVLRGDAEIADVIQQTPTDRLDMIAAGRCDALAIQALAQDYLRILLERLGNRYDFIIVDTAPVLLVADSLLISQHIDAVLFSILRDRSRLPKVYAAYERLATLGVRTLGAVISGVNSDSYHIESYYAQPLLERAGA